MGRNGEALMLLIEPVNKRKRIYVDGLVYLNWCYIYLK